MKCLRALVVASLTGWPGAALALQSNVGGNTAEFLKIGAGARALGMGEAFGPVAEGAETIYWNPAGLAKIKRPLVSYTRSEFLGFFHHAFLAYAHPVEALKGTLAGSYTRLSQQALPLVTNANIQIGEFSPQSHALALAYAHAFGADHAGQGANTYLGEPWSESQSYARPRHETEPWSGVVAVGLSLKAINETIYDKNATALAVDAGLIIRPVNLEALNLSLALRNAGSPERFGEQSENLPTEVAFGVSYDHRSAQSRLLPAFELALPYYGSPNAKLGVEYQQSASDQATISMRAGFKTLTAADLNLLSGITVGIGVQLRRFTLDFGFQPLAELGQVYRMTGGLRW